MDGKSVRGAMLGYKHAIPEMLRRGSGSSFGPAMTFAYIAATQLRRNPEGSFPSSFQCSSDHRSRAAQSA